MTEATKNHASFTRPATRLSTINNESTRLRQVPNRLTGSSPVIDSVEMSTIGQKKRTATVSTGTLSEAKKRKMMLNEGIQLNSEPQKSCSSTFAKSARIEKTSSDTSVDGYNTGMADIAVKRSHKKKPGSISSTKITVKKEKTMVTRSVRKDKAVHSRRQTKNSTLLARNAVSHPMVYKRLHPEFNLMRRKKSDGETKTIQSSDKTNQTNIISKGNQSVCSKGSKMTHLKHIKAEHNNTTSSKGPITLFPSADGAVLLKVPKIVLNSCEIQGKFSRGPTIQDVTKTLAHPGLPSLRVNSTNSAIAGGSNQDGGDRRPVKSRGVQPVFDFGKIVKFHRDLSKEQRPLSVMVVNKPQANTAAVSLGSEQVSFAMNIHNKSPSTSQVPISSNSDVTPNKNQQSPGLSKKIIITRIPKFSQLINNDQHSTSCGVNIKGVIVKTKEEKDLQSDAATQISDSEMDNTESHILSEEISEDRLLSPDYGKHVLDPKTGDIVKSGITNDESEGDLNADKNDEDSVIGSKISAVSSNHRQAQSHNEKKVIEDTGRAILKCLSQGQLWHGGSDDTQSSRLQSSLSNTSSGGSFKTPETQPARTSQSNETNINQQDKRDNISPATNSEFLRLNRSQPPSLTLCKRLVVMQEVAPQIKEVALQWADRYEYTRDGYSGYVTSYEKAMVLLKKYQLIAERNFIIVKQTFENLHEEISQSRALMNATYLLWRQTASTATTFMDLDHDDVPFIICASRVYNCDHGPHSKRVQNIKPKNDGNCPANIQMRKVIKFIDFKDMWQVGLKDIQTAGSAAMETRYYIGLPHEDAHTDHEHSFQSLPLSKLQKPKKLKIPKSVRVPKLPPPTPVVTTRFKDEVSQASQSDTLHQSNDEYLPVLEALVVEGRAKEWARLFDWTRDGYWGYVRSYERSREMLKLYEIATCNSFFPVGGGGSTRPISKESVIKRLMVKRPKRIICTDTPWFSIEDATPFMYFGRIRFLCRHGYLARYSKNQSQRKTDGCSARFTVRIFIKFTDYIITKNNAIAKFWTTTIRDAFIADPDSVNFETRYYIQLSHENAHNHPNEPTYLSLKSSKRMPTKSTTPKFTPKRIRRKATEPKASITKADMQPKAQPNTSPQPSTGSLRLSTSSPQPSTSSSQATPQPTPSSLQCTPASPLPTPDSLQLDSVPSYEEEYMPIIEPQEIEGDAHAWAELFEWTLDGYWGYVSTYEKAMELLGKYEDTTQRRFVSCGQSCSDLNKSVPKEQVIKRLMVKKPKRIICDNTPWFPIEDAIPFMYYGRIRYECQYGRDSHAGTKAKRLSQGFEIRQNPPCKKMDCPAKCNIRVLVKFTDYRVSNTNAVAKFWTNAIRNAFITNPDAVTIETRYYLQLVRDSEHISHPKCHDLISRMARIANNLHRDIIHPDKYHKNTRRLRKKLPMPNLFSFYRYTTRHIALKIVYVGWDYHGFVVQDDHEKTIEAELFSALVKTCLVENRETSNYHRCGRTDKGVSAFSQVISLDVRSNLVGGVGVKEREDMQAVMERPGDKTKELQYVKILNRVLPTEIRVLAWAPVNTDFSARFDCSSRVYKYFFPVGNLNVQAMANAAVRLIGEHDFRNLCKMDVANGVTNYMRRIDSTELLLLDQRDNGYQMCELTITGQAFLWHQIRCIMAVLFMVGEGKETPLVIESLLDVERFPQKPQYTMATELPLVLFSCEFEDVEWNYDADDHIDNIKHIQELWAKEQVKSTMLLRMLEELQEIPVSYKGKVKHWKDHGRKVLNQTPWLIPGKQPNLCNHKPLMDRPVGDSLEEKVKKAANRINRKAKATSVKEEIVSMEEVQAATETIVTEECDAATSDAIARLIGSMCEVESS